VARSKPQLRRERTVLENRVFMVGRGLVVNS
jgi:hypothetical protein